MDPEEWLAEVGAGPEDEPQTPNEQRAAGDAALAEAGVLPPDMRETGEARTTVQLGETTIEGDPRGRRGRVSYDPTGEGVVEERLIAKVAADKGPDGARVGEDRRSALERLGAWATGEDPEALPYVQYAGLGGIGMVGADEDDPMDFGGSGVEVPSTHSLGRAIQSARSGGGVGDVLGSLFPTSSYDEGEDVSGQDYRYLGAATGATDAATLGWADEVAGDADVAERAREQAPDAYGIGQVGGSAPYALIPGGAPTVGGRMALAGGVGVGLGTVRGAGESEASLADDPGQVASDAVTGGALEGLASAGTVGVGEGLALPALRRLGRWSSELAPGASDRATQAALEARGIWGRRAMQAAQDRPGGVERLVQDLDEAEFPLNPRDTPRRIDELLRDAGPRVGEVRREVETASDVARSAAPEGYYQRAAEVPGRVDVRRIMDRIEALARREAQAPVGGRQRATALRRFVEDLEPLADEGMSFSQAHQQRQTIDDMISRWSPDPNLSSAAGQRQSLRQIVSDEMGSAAEGVGLGQQWRDANRRYALGSWMDDFGRGVERLNVQGGIGGAIHRARGIGSALSGNPAGLAEAGLAPAIQQEARLRLPGMQARLFRRLAPLLERGSPALQRAADELGSAMSAGQPATAAAHFVLSQTNPEYRAATERARDEE